MSGLVSLRESRPVWKAKNVPVIVVHLGLFSVDDHVFLSADRDGPQLT